MGAPLGIRSGSPTRAPACAPLGRALSWIERLCRPLERRASQRPFRSARASHGVRLVRSVLPLARLAAALIAVSLMCAARTSAAADGLVIPHVGIDDDLQRPPMGAQAWRSVSAALGNAPIAVRLVIHRTDLEAGDQLSFTALDGRLASYGPSVRVWLVFGDPPAAAGPDEIAAWRQYVARGSGAHAWTCPGDRTPAERPAGRSKPTPFCSRPRPYRRGPRMPQY